MSAFLLTSDQMLSLPEIGDFGSVVIINSVHATVFQPVGSSHPSPLDLHGVHSDVPAEFQDHLARYHLPTGESCISGTVQLQAERLNGTHSYMCGQKSSSLYFGQG